MFTNTNQNHDHETYYDKSPSFHGYPMILPSKFPPGFFASKIHRNNFSGARVLEGIHRGTLHFVHVNHVQQGLFLLPPHVFNIFQLAYELIVDKSCFY